LPTFRRFMTLGTSSAACAVTSAVILCGFVRVYGWGPHGGEMGISALIGAGWAILFALTGVVLGLLALRSPSKNQRRLGVLAALVNVGVLGVVCASGALSNI
jgi:hypothetical protein